MAVKYVIVWLDRCFRWIFDILSGPVAGEFLIVLMVFCVFVGVFFLIICHLYHLKCNVNGFD